MLDTLRKRLRSEKGFTLIELLVVMIIMAILVAAGLAFHFGARERASDATAKSNISLACDPNSVRVQSTTATFLR